MTEHHILTLLEDSLSGTQQQSTIYFSIFQFFQTHFLLICSFFDPVMVFAEHLLEDYRLTAHWALDEEVGEIAYGSANWYAAIVHTLRSSIHAPLS